MKKIFFKTSLFIIAFFMCNISFAQFAKKENDTLSRKEHREFVKTQRKSALKESHKRFLIKGAYFFSNLSTDMSFGDVISLNLSLEDDFGLSSNKSFVTGSFIYFITPRSGIYSNYFSIKRSASHTTTRELTFLDTTIPGGLEVDAYFNTKIFSAGYLLTILRDSRVFLGVYLNIFFMDLETGVSTKDKQIDESLEYLLPLPNFGFVANFEITEWLYFDAAAGFFSLNLKDSGFEGSIYNVSSALTFKPLDWLGVSINYEIFDINVSDRYDLGDTYIPYDIEYHFKGPSVGLSFNF